MRKTGWIGVDFGAHAVKLAQIERAGGGLRLRDALIIGRTTPSSGGAADPATFRSVDELRAGLSLGEGFSGKRIACAASMQLCDVRMMDLPADTVGDRTTMIRQELNQLLPNYTRDRVFDYWDVSRPPEPHDAEGRNSVGVLSMPQGCALRIARDVSKVGYRCEVLDGTPLALSRAVTMATPKSDTDVVAALDLGFSSTTFCVMWQGRPLYVRALRGCSVKDILNSLSVSLDFAFEEAQLILQKYGLPPSSDSAVPEEPMQQLVADTIAGRLRVLSEELCRTLSYLQTHHRTLAPKKIWLFGCGATIRNLSEWLTEKAGVAAKTWHLPEMDLTNVNATDCPIHMVGIAIALSALAWEP